MFNAQMEELRPARVPKMKKTRPQADKHDVCHRIGEKLSEPQVKALRAAVIAGLNADTKKQKTAK